MEKEKLEMQSIVDSCVFHYTNAGTLAGMLKNVSKENGYLRFWASHTSYMNDPKEKKYGIEKMWEVLPNIEEDLSIPRGQRITELDKRELGTFIFNRNIDENSWTNVYSISFSKAFDYLPMWNMYGQNGSGICLGFDMNELNKFLKNRKMEALAKMKYGIGESIINPDTAKTEMTQWKEYVKHYYQYNKNFIIEHLDMDKQSPDDVDMFITLTLYISLLAFIPGQIKNPAYEYEQEYRLYCRELGNKVLFRDRNGLLIPYVEVKIPLNILKIVAVGPTSDKDRQIMSIAKLLKANVNDYEKLIFYSSEIPYRL